MDSSTSRRMRRWVDRLLGDVEGGLAHLLLIPAILGYLALVLPEWIPPLNESETLDGGYRAVLNEAWLNGWQFGTEVVTTTGPLGFLRNTVHYDGTDGARTGWAMLLAVVLTVLFAKLFLDRSPLVTAINLGATILLLALVKQQGWLLLPVVGLLFLFAKVVDRQPRTAPWELLLTAFLAASSLVLFVELVSGTIVVAGVALVHYVRFRKVSPVPLAFAAFLLLVWLGSGQRPSGIVPYLRASLEVAGGYGEVMALPCEAWWWAPAGAGALLVVVATAVRGVASVEGRKLAMALGGPLSVVGWLVFKSSFTRCQISRVVVYSMILGFVALGAFNTARRLRGENRGWASASALPVACCLLLGLAYLGSLGMAEPTRWMAFGLRMPFHRARELASRLGRPERLEERHAMERASIRKRYPLPPIDGTVDWFGDRQGILLAHDLDYHPRPVFQRFSAYTPFLAGLNAEQYAGRRAPDAVIFDSRGFDPYPLMLFDGPALLRLVESYHASGPPENELLVLHRGTPRPTDRTVALESTVRIGEWVDLAALSGHGALWVEVEVEDTLLGRLAKLAFRGDRLWLDVELEQGVHQRFLFATPPARSGFWLSPLLADGAAVERLFRYGLDSLPDEARVRAVRLYQPPSAVRQREGATFRVSRIAPRQPSLSPMAPGAFSEATLFVDGFESGSAGAWTTGDPVEESGGRSPR